MAASSSKSPQVVFSAVSAVSGVAGIQLTPWSLALVGLGVGVGVFSFRNEIAKAASAIKARMPEGALSERATGTIQGVLLVVVLGLLAWGALALLGRSESSEPYTFMLTSRETKQLDRTLEPMKGQGAERTEEGYIQITAPFREEYRFEDKSGRILILRRKMLDLAKPLDSVHIEDLHEPGEGANRTRA